MPHCIDSVEVSRVRQSTPTTRCSHQYIRIEKWSESEITESRVTDDFGRKTGPLHHRRMTTVFEKYRCELCGDEDVQSYTVWSTR